ncbi:MAG: 50S ribosomal protein L29 [Alphaproteobacteria bacterium]|nr:50S ribosomal protein L29 [Alphaproteobacteria bacterium]
MKFSELMGKDKKELLQMYVEFKREYMNLRIASKVSQDVKPSAVRACHKNIAMVKTRLTQLGDK